MTTYTVDLQTRDELKYTFTVDARAKYDAARKVVERASISPEEAEELHAFVYETNTETIGDAEIIAVGTLL